MLYYSITRNRFYNLQIRHPIKQQWCIEGEDPEGPKPITGVTTLRGFIPVEKRLFARNFMSELLSLLKR